MLRIIRFTNKRSTIRPISNRIGGLCFTNIRNNRAISIRHYSAETTSTTSTTSTASTSSSDPTQTPESSKINNISYHDVIIIGGGPAGLTLFTALKNSKFTENLDVVLVEGSSMERIRNWNLPDDVYENRASSLTPTSVSFLKSIGAWDHIHTERVKAYDEMKVWDGSSDARIEFDPYVLGEHSEIATMVENANLQNCLLTRLHELDSNATIIDSARVKSISKSSETSSESLEWPTVELENGQRLSGRLLVGADGGNSPVRTFAGIQSRGWDYNRFGLVSIVKQEWEDFRSIAWQRFLVNGPVALLPLPNGYCNYIWSTTPERAQHLKSLSPAAFAAMANASFRLKTVDLDYLHTLTDEATIIDEVEWRLQNTKLIDEDNNYPIPIVDVLENSRAAFPLKMKHADSYVSERVALVGDAAHSTHPLAGQGLNMGQSDVANLVHALELANKRGLDIGSLLALEPYWAKSYWSNHAKIGVTDKLHKLYNSDFPPLVQLRSWGLNFVNESPFIKRFLMSGASR